MLSGSHQAFMLIHQLATVETMWFSDCGCEDCVDVLYCATSYYHC